MSKLKPGQVVRHTNQDDFSPNKDKFVVLNKEGSDIHVYDIQHDEATYLSEEYVEPLKDKPWKIVSKKVDEYTFVGAKKGRERIISAGCRLFHHIQEARLHWSNTDIDGAHYHLVHDESNEDNAVNRSEANNRRLKAAEKIWAKLNEKES